MTGGYIDDGGTMRRNKLNAAKFKEGGSLDILKL
jgi:hypothetical protein